MCESPMCLTEEEASKLSQLALEKHLLFAVSYPYCFFSMLRYVNPNKTNNFIGT